MKASITIHTETLWSNRVELEVEAELDNPHSAATQEVISMMIETAQNMVAEARSENQRLLLTQEAVNRRHRELDDWETRLEEREKGVSAREVGASVRDDQATQRDVQADLRERRQMEREVHAQREE